MDRRNFNNEGDLGISIETTNIAFDTAWRGDFDPDEFKLTLPPKAIFSSQLQYDDPCWCQKTKYESPGCILYVNMGLSSNMFELGKDPNKTGLSVRPKHVCNFFIIKNCHVITSLDTDKKTNRSWQRD